jgi:hypothetical protein
VSMHRTIARSAIGVLIVLLVISVRIIASPSAPSLVTGHWLTVRMTFSGPDPDSMPKVNPDTAALTLSYGTRFSHSDLLTYPTSRDLWGLIEILEGSSVVNRVDAGGVFGGERARWSTRGSSWTQNHYYLNGLDVTDPYEGGVPLYFPDYDALDEVQVLTAGLRPDQPGAGGLVELTTRSASAGLHGQGGFYYQGSPTGWANFSPGHRALGALPNREIREDFQAHALLGGSIGRSPWRVLGSVSGRDLSVRVPGYPETERRTVESGQAELSRATSRQLIRLLWTGQRVVGDHHQASFRTPISATLVREDSHNVLQGGWLFPSGPHSFLETRLGWAQAGLAGRFPENAERQQAGLDLFTGFQSGLAPLQSEATRGKFSINSQFRYVKGQNQIDAGVEASRGRSSSRLEAFQDVGLRFLPLDTGSHPLVRSPTVPSTVLLYNTPVHPQERVRQAALYARHSLRPLPRIRLDYGVRLDSVAGWLPAQGSPAGSFAAARSFQAAENVISWTDWEPRIGIAWAPGRGMGTVFRLGYARYHHSLPARYLNFANPNSLSGTVWAWEDTSGDRLFQPGEQVRILRAFGGLASSVDPGLRRPSTREMMLGLEQRLGAGFAIRADFFRRRDKNRVETVNLGVPFSSYTPVPVLDPGGDFVPGTADDQRLTVYNQDPSTLGDDFLHLTNPPGLGSFYEGAESTLSYRFRTSAALALVFAAYRTRAFTNPGNSELENDPGIIGELLDNPNSLIGTNNRLFFDRAFTARLFGSWRISRRWNLATATRYYDGRPFGRKLVLTGLNQGPFFIHATPRGDPVGHRTEFNLTLDIRVKHTLPWRGGRVSLLFDVFNLLNSDYKTEEADLSGPLFLQRIPLEYQPPRIARLGAQFAF